MSVIDKIKDGFFKQLGTTAALLVLGLVAWSLSQVAPIVMPAIVHALPSEAFVAILLMSIIINVVLCITVWQLAKPKNSFKLVYGILWDKQNNPHCPACEGGGVQYRDWGYSGVGYNCKKCKAVYGLTDAAGIHKRPEDVLHFL